LKKFSQFPCIVINHWWMQHVKCTLGTKLNCITIVGPFMILKHWTTLHYENDQQCLSRFDGLVSELELKPIPDLICWLLACKEKMTELCSFHLVTHFWGNFFRCYYVVPHALVSFEVPFTVIRFSGNYLKTEMLKLFRIFKEKCWKLKNYKTTLPNLLKIQDWQIVKAQ